MEILILLVVIGTSIWVYFDAKALGAQKGKIKGMLNMNPGEWFFVTLLLWIVGFPAWLVARGTYKIINANTEKIAP